MFSVLLKGHTMCVLIGMVCANPPASGTTSWENSRLSVDLDKGAETASIEDGKKSFRTGTTQGQFGNQQTDMASRQATINIPQEQFNKDHSNDNLEQAMQLESNVQANQIEQQTRKMEQLPIVGLGSIWWSHELNSEADRLPTLCLNGRKSALKTDINCAASSHHNRYDKNMTSATILNDTNSHNPAAKNTLEVRDNEDEYMKTQYPNTFWNDSMSLSMDDTSLDSPTQSLPSQKHIDRQNSALWEADYLGPPENDTAATRTSVRDNNQLQLCVLR